MRHAERGADLAAQRELPLQLERRGLAVRLVLRVDLVAIAHLEAFVERHGDVPRRFLLEQLGQEARKAEHGVDGVAVAVDDLDGHRRTTRGR